MYTTKMRITLFGAVAALAVIAVIVSLSVPVPVAKAAGAGGVLTVDVLLDSGATFNIVGAPLGGGPFHVHGTLYPAGTVAPACPSTPGVDLIIGTFDCWGFIPGAGGPGLINQEFNIDGRGKIQVQGQEGPTSIIAVVGGTGEFVNVRGEATRRDQDVCDPDSPLTARFTVDFDLIGASH